MHVIMPLHLCIEFVITELLFILYCMWDCLVLDIKFIPQSFNLFHNYFYIKFIKACEAGLA